MNRKSTMRILLLLSALVSFYLRSWAIDAASASFADVQTAYNAAALNEQINIPAGSATWTSKLTMTKAVRLVGAGVGQTIITRNNGSDSIISCGPTNGTWSMIRGIEFRDTGGGSPLTAGIVTMSKTLIYECSFDPVIAAVVAYSTHLYPAVVSKTTFAAGNTAMTAFGGTNAWDNAVVWGSTNGLYAEDCFVTNNSNGAVDAYNGARYVYRFSTNYNSWVNHHGCDSGGYRSAHSSEWYGNKMFYNGGGSVAYFFRSRGGTSLGCSNVMSGSNNGWFDLRNFRQGGTNSQCAISLSDCPPWGSAGVAAGSTNPDGTNPIDGNSDTNGYPTLDQFGWTGPTAFLSTNSTQAASPGYFWANSGTAPALNEINANATIQLDRDYFTNAPVGVTFADYPHPLVTHFIGSAVGISVKVNPKFSRGKGRR